MYTWILHASTPAYIPITYCHGTSQLHTTRCFTQPWGPPALGCVNHTSTYTTYT